jgi:hypothetical protein
MMLSSPFVFCLLVAGMALGTWIALAAGGRRLAARGRRPDDRARLPLEPGTSAEASPPGVGRSAGESRLTPAGWLPWFGWSGLLVAVALFAARPFLGVDKVGAGDAYHYALQLEDVRTQAHAGVFPVLVGQSRFGFNGNVHTLRTAPLFVHLGLVLDRLTDGRLESYALEHAIALLATLGCAAAMWFVLLARGVTGPALAAGGAALYATGAAVLGSLLGGEMYATFVAAPWIPVVLLGLGRWVERGPAGSGSALTLAALALVWYAHPPTGAVLTPVVVIAWLTRVWIEPRRGRMLAATALALLVWLVLCAYLFVSVGSMRLGYFAREQDTGVANVLSGLPQLWPALLGFIREHHRSVADVHPGWPVLALAAVGGVLLRARPARAAWPAWALAAYVLALLPGPSSRLIWHLVPDRVIAFVNPWPHQRMMPIVAALAVMWGTGSLSGWIGANRRRLGFAAAALAAGVVWNLAELRELRPYVQPGERRILPANVVLTRSSYLLFNARPEYFSDSPAEPVAETRLLDESLHPLLTDAEFLFRAAAEHPVLPAESRPTDSRPATGARSTEDPRRRAEASLAIADSGGSASDEIAPGEPSAIVSGWLPVGAWREFPLREGWGCALEFRFTRPEAVGEITLTSGPMVRVFSLPKSGDRLAFGSGQAASHTLLIPAPDHDGRTLGITSTVPDVSVRLRFYQDEELPIRILSLIPFTVRVRSPKSGYVETPKMALPGYEAAVDGQAVSVRRSPQGLVMVPIAAGESVVRVTYRPWYLRWSYGLSLGAFVALTVAGGVLSRPRARARAARRLGRLGRRLGRPRTLIVGAGAIAALAVALVAAHQIHERHWLRLSVVLAERPPPLPEPLLTLGHTGEADLVYVRVIDPTHVQIGYDHWGRGGPVSPPIRHVPGEPMQVEIRSPALPTRWPSLGREPDPDLTEIIVDGQTVLSGDLAHYPNTQREVALGQNLIGASSCSDHFSGRIEREGWFRLN